METVLTALLQILMLGVLVTYFALIGAALYAIGWVVTRTLRHHFAMRESWHEAKDRLFGSARH